MWKIHFRSADGMDEMLVNAATVEDAEFLFSTIMESEQLFGVIVRVVPTDGSPAPVA